jgi:hypothetical protein
MKLLIMQFSPKLKCYLTKLCIMLSLGMFSELLLGYRHRHLLNLYVSTVENQINRTIVIQTDGNCVTAFVIITVYSSTL